MLPKQDMAWWYWLAMLPLLTVGLLGERNGFFLAALLILTQIMHFWFREKNMDAFAVQVRIGYLAWFAAGQLPYMQWMLWLQLAATSISVLINYCAMARLLALAPWNRHRPMTLRLVLRVIFSKPVRGSILNAV